MAFLSHSIAAASSVLFAGTAVLCIILLVPAGVGAVYPAVFFATAAVSAAGSVFLSIRLRREREKWYYLLPYAAVSLFLAVFSGLWLVSVFTGTPLLRQVSLALVPFLFLPPAAALFFLAIPFRSPGEKQIPVALSLVLTVLCCMLYVLTLAASGEPDHYIEFTGFMYIFLALPLLGVMMLMTGFYAESIYQQIQGKRDE